MIIVEFKNIDGKPEVGKWVSNGRNIGPVLKSDGVNVTINGHLDGEIEYYFDELYCVEASTVKTTD